MKYALPTHRHWFIFTLTFVLICAIGSPVHTASAGAQTFTLHFSDVVETVQITNPCFGPAVGVLMYDGVVHVTENSNGFHTVAHIHGDSAAVPEDPNEPPFSGSFSESQVLNLNRQNAVSSFVVTQRTHGLKFHITFKLTLTPGGGELSVFNVTCEH